METKNFENLELAFSSQIKEYAKEHTEWLKRFLIKQMEGEDFKERQYHLLKEFLPSPFLIHEELLNEKDVAHASEFIAGRPILKDFADKSSEPLHYWAAKLALLTQIIPLQCNGLKFNQLEHLDNYLTLYQDELSKKALLDFVRFVTLIQACYNEYLQFMENSMKDPKEKDILHKLLDLVDQGDWNAPATRENIKEMLKTCLLRDAHYTKEDIAYCEKFWNMLKNGSGDRIVITFQNLIGYWRFQGYLAGSGPELKKMFFGSRNVDYTEIDKGAPGKNNMSETFEEILPFLDNHLPR